MSTTVLETLDLGTLARVTGGVGLAQGPTSATGQAPAGAATGTAATTATAPTTASASTSAAAQLTKMQQQAVASLQLPQPPRLGSASSSSGGGDMSDMG